MLVNFSDMELQRPRGFAFLKIAGVPRNLGDGSIFGIDHSKNQDIRSRKSLQRKDKLSNILRSIVVIVFDSIIYRENRKMMYRYWNDSGRKILPRF